MATNNTIHTLLHCEFGDNEIWSDFQNLLSSLSNQNIGNVFQYSICSITKLTRQNYLYCIIKGYLISDSTLLQVNQQYWNYFRKWLEDNLFSIATGYRNPLLNKDWVTNDHDYYIEYGEIIPAIQTYVSSVLFSISPIKTAENLCAIFANCNSDIALGEITALVIEEYKNEIKYPFIKWCCSAKEDGILSPRRLRNIEKIHIIHPNRTQTYHTFGLERNTHYSIKVKNLECFKWICNAIGLRVMEYLPSIEICNSGNLCVVNSDTTEIPFKQIYESMKQIKKLGGLRNRNDVWLVSYGFSGRARQYIGGPPCLTKGIGGHTGNNNILVKLALPILEILTEKILFHFREKICVDEIRNALFAERIGENFELRTHKFNLFEGLDFAITSGLGDNILAPHCDVMNDWRPGHNFCSVAKSIVFDEDNQRSVQVVFIAYTRKDIGDYLYGAGVFL